MKRDASVGVKIWIVASVVLLFGAIGCEIWTGEP